METNLLESVSTREYTLNIAKQTDVVEAFYISKVVLSDFLRRSIVHADLFSNLYEKLNLNIEKQSLYILKKKNVSLAMLTFEESEPEEYKGVSWECKGNACFYVSRLFVLPFWRNKGIGGLLLNFAEELAREKGYNTIKLDITSSFDEGNMLLMSHNYRFAGNIYYTHQKAPVNCYEKTI